MHVIVFGPFLCYVGLIFINYFVNFFLMFGHNPIRPPVKGAGEALDVQQIFPTFQGEGPYTGHPAVFIRLGGCNLACGFCDTEFEQFSSWQLADILSEVHRLAVSDTGERIRPLVVITGGEPLRQPIELLCKELLLAGFKVQIETNGTLYRPLPQGVDIVCSPKNIGNGYYHLRPDLLPHITALKFVISRSFQGYDHVPEVGQKLHNIPVYVQPMDEQDEVKNKENLLLTVQIALEKGYRFSIQTHKIAGVL